MPAAIRGAVSRGSSCLGRNKYLKGLDKPKVRDEVLKFVETAGDIGESIVKMPFCGASDRTVQWVENAHTWAVIARGGSGIWFNGVMGVKNTFNEADKTLQLAHLASRLGAGAPVFFDGHDFDSRTELHLGVASHALKAGSQALCALAFGVCQLIRLPVLIDKLRDRSRFDALNFPEPLKSIGEAFDPVMMGRAYLSAGGTAAEMVREGIHYKNGGVYYPPGGRLPIPGARARLDEFIRRMINHICGLLDSAFKGTVYLFKVFHLEAVHPVFGVLGIIFNIVSVVFGGIKTVRSL